MRITVANTFLKRLVGFIGRRDIEAHGAMLFPGCARVHTFFMRAPIDVAILDQNMKVLKIFYSVPPWRVVPRVSGAAMCLEVAAGMVARQGIVPGMKIKCV
ncbi:DUF192 domain-containing protein [Candidatus Uhrbacteria bacterium]|nr:DUF192 domain-containing protein [Candidatus Uhrbacteria bacterium]